jgi:hypothetical protein
MLRMKTGRKFPREFGHRRRRRHHRREIERQAAAGPVDQRPTSGPSKCSCVLEAADGPCKGRLLPFPGGIHQVAAVINNLGRVVVRPVTQHPRAVGYYMVDRAHRGEARYVEAAA